MVCKDVLWKEGWKRDKGKGEERGWGKKREMEWREYGWEVEERKGDEGEGMRWDGKEEGRAGE